MNLDKTRIGYLEKWELPFSNSLCLSVTAIIPPNTVDRVMVVVMRGLGSYPGYLLDFESAPVLLVSDETCAPPPIPEWFDLFKTIPRSKTVIWHDSPMVKLNAGIGSNLKEIHIEKLKLTHYLILGDDSTVDILAYKKPLITEFQEPLKITMEYLF
jgi:hypothetical protein